MGKLNDVKKKNKKNYANRFSAILLVALIVNLGLYWLPKTIGGLTIKKVDLLSDIRISSEFDENDDLISLLEEDEEEEPAPKVASASKDVNPTVNLPSSTNSTTSVQNPPKPTSSQKEKNDLTQKEQKQNKNEDKLAQSSSNTPTTDETKEKEDKYRINDVFSSTQIEDFTSGHTGLRRFFAALNNIDNLGRPVRIAFVGDSFIEGDILVADFRAKMQSRFGGHGVGFVPVTSHVAQYRPTIKQSSDGWKTYSLIKSKRHKYTLSGLMFEPVSSNASIRFQTVDMYPGLEKVSSLKFIYSQNSGTDMIIKSDADTSLYELPPTNTVTQYELNGNFTKGTLQFKNAEGLKALGIALEDNHGVIVDNFSLRGNSGIIMTELDGESCRDLQKIRPYDLIVLQYGLNVASDSVREYGWYKNKMIAVIEHLQNCFPGADILMLGVSDRSHKRGGSYSTMPAVLSLLKAQRQTARQTEVAFWSIFAAMGGQNSMVKYVRSNWASKDYTHLSFRGGREVANALYDALITEKGMYDSDERLVEK